jgi:hypothetical protein
MAETTKNKSNKYKPKAEADSGASVTAEPLNDGDTLLDGFTATQIAALARVKQDVASGRYSDMTPEHRKWLFAKWLVEHDRISG